MKAALYLRVSSEYQNLDMQRTDLLRYCEMHKIEFDIFEEKVSGKTANRPELKKMMALIKECHYDRVIVWRLDRFGRSVRDLSNLLADLESAKCTFVSFKEHLDLSTPSGKLMVSLLSSFAEFELNSSKDRQRAGIAAARIRGQKFGRPGKYVLPLQIKQEKAKGFSMREISKRLGLSKSRLYQILADDNIFE